MESHLVFQEQCFQLSLRPVVQSIGQKLHGDGVDPEEIANEDDPVDVLQAWRKRWEC